MATNNDFYFSSIGKRSGMVNVMKVDGLGIFLKSGVNSPKGGKLRNPFSRRVERRGGDVSRSTPIASVGPLDQIYLPRVGRIGSLGSGHKARDASELGESQRVLSSVHRVHVSDTVGPGVRSVTVGPLGSSESLGSVHMTGSTVSENSLSPGACQFKSLRAQTDGLTDGSDSSSVSNELELVKVVARVNVKVKEKRGGRVSRRRKARGRRNRVRWWSERGKELLVEKPECVVCYCNGMDSSELGIQHCICTCYILSSGFRLLEDGGDLNLPGGELPEVEMVGGVPVPVVESRADPIPVVESGDVLVPVVKEGAGRIWENEDWEDRYQLGDLGEREVEKIREYQKEGICLDTRKWVMEKESRPSKVESLKYDSRQLSILRYIDFFKISKNGLIYRIFVGEKGDSKALILLDKQALVNVAVSIHEELGHCGKRNVYSIVKRKYYSPGLENLLKGVFDSCVVCMKYNIPKPLRHKLSTLLAITSCDELQMDLVGPLPRSSKGFRFILCCIDACSREVVLRPLKTATAQEMAENLCSLFGEVGVYRRVRIDYKCLSMKQIDVKILETLGVEIVRSNNCSRAQGVVERANQQVVIRMLKLLSEESDLSKWSETLKTVATAMNLTPHSSLGGRSPFDVTRRFAFRWMGPTVGSLPVGIKGDFVWSELWRLSG